MMWWTITTRKKISREMEGSRKKGEVSKFNSGGKVKKVSRVNTGGKNEAERR